MAPRQEAAPFVPISPTINIPLLVSSTPNFKSVQRIDARRINPTNIESLQAMIHEHVVLRGIPIVIENWHLRSDWPKWIFSMDWLKSNHGGDQISVRDIPNKADIPMTLGHYLNNMAKLTSKFTPSNYDGRQQRLYGKDLDCPPVWRSGLANIIPESTFYLSTRADLMSSLPKDARAENMMCYVGHEGTYTPAHMEMCATLGQNIMIAASQEGPNSEKGSSLWFMTQMADREAVAEYWTGTLGHDLSIEAHFASIEDLQAAPFTVFVLEQKLGDYVLVPPLAPHQVWNRGTTTVKAAWNRVTVDTLEHALREALPKIRLVCRDEQYKTKAIVYDTLRNYTKVLARDDEAEMKLFPPTIKDDFIRLYNLFTSILMDECFSPLLPKETKVDMIPNEYNITCSFCRGNIFNRFLSCKRCPPSMQGLEDDPYDICMECYARGRSCFCVSGLSWVEQHPWVDLLTDHEKFRGAVVKILKEKGKANETPEKIAAPPRFPDALASMSKERKGLARVCQEALRARPYLDPNTIDDLDDEREIAKKKKEGKLLNCHTCGYRHPSWKAMLCTNKDCGKAYCFGNLWRAYDMDPFDDCLAKHHWKCPVCLGFCACGRCRKKPNHQPYTPKGTILGAATKHVADVRSIESLVDFSKGNVGWLQNGVSGGKPSSQDGAEGGDAISKWGPTFGATDIAEPDTAGREEDPQFPGEFSDRNVVATPAGYKAHLSAAGLDVASIPIDPALRMTGYLDSFGSSKREQNGDYLKQFENPPDIQISPRRYHRTEPSGVTPLNSDSVEPMQRHHVHESDINPALIDDPSNASVQASQSNGAHEYQQWESHPQNAPTPNLSTLERDPLAFLAAAGLRHAQQQEEGVDEWGNPYQDSYNHYGGPVLHPTETFGSDDEQDAPGEPYGLSGAFEHHEPNIDPSLTAEGEKAKGKPKKQGLSKKERRERVQGDLEFEQVEKGTVAEWVLDRTKKSKKRKGTLLVTLKISPDAWRRHDARIAKQKEEKAAKLAARFGLDEVGTDLAPDPKRRRLDGKMESPSTKKKGGRPPGSRKIYADVSDDEGDNRRLNELLSDEDQEIMPKKSRRSTRTGDLVDGLTFETSRRTTLNKSSHPSPPKGNRDISTSASTKSKGFPDAEANLPVAWDNEDEVSVVEDIPASKSRNTRNDIAGSGYNQEDIDRALRDAKRMALAAAEGRSPPPMSVYSSEAQSHAGSEDDEESYPGFEVSIESRKPTGIAEADRGSEGSMSPVVGDIRPPPAARNVRPKTPVGANRKPGPRPSRPLSKRSRPGRPKKADADYVAPRKPASVSGNGFTPINNRTAPNSGSTTKRGRPRKDSSANNIASLGINSAAAGSPPAKRPRRDTAATPNKPAAIDTSAKTRGQLRKSLSTPTGPTNGTASPAASKSSVTKSSTPKRKPGRPARSSLSGIDMAVPKPAKTTPFVPVFTPAALDASRSCNVIELMRHSPPVGGDDDDDDWL